MEIRNAFGKGVAVKQEDEMISFEKFCANCELLRERVRSAAEKCGRNHKDISILPVTKTHPAEAAQFAERCGFKAVGENRVQEALEKMPLLSGNLEWELIGHLQSNKAKAAVGAFSRIQSVDSEKLLLKIDSAARELSKKMRVLIEVNAGADPAKFGIDIESAPRLLEFALRLENVSVEGLMTVAPLGGGLDAASRCFANLRNLRDKLEADFSLRLPELSMGMSHDLERAVAEGASVIRVGTFLFGERDYAADKQSI